VLGETCPQYLVLTEEDLDRPGFEGAKYVFSPPARPAGAPERVWEALAEGVIQTVHSDHAGYRFDDAQGKKLHGEDAPFHRIPNGVPGLETRLPILFSEGVGKGRIDLRRFVELTAENPARLFGLYPGKGVIRVGSDADLTIWDPDATRAVSIGMLHDNMDYTPYEGMSVRGWPTTTVSRGRMVWHDGKPRGKVGQGGLLRRSVPRVTDFPLAR
jgi:dihydropyrimidinase